MHIYIQSDCFPHWSPPPSPSVIPSVVNTGGLELLGVLSDVGRKAHRCARNQDCHRLWCHATVHPGVPTIKLPSKQGLNKEWRQPPGLAPSCLSSSTSTHSAGQDISRGADSGKRLWSLRSRADSREMKKSRELAELLGSHLCSVSATSWKGHWCPPARASRDPMDELPLLFLNPSSHVREKRTGWGRVWRGQGAGSSPLRQPGSRGCLLQLHPHLATKLQPGSPFGFFTFWLLISFR